MMSEKRQEEFKEEIASLTTLVKSAKGNQFDPYGYRSDRPLKKRIFYSQPYLTCQYCNTIYFISNDKTRYLDAVEHANHRLPVPDLEVYTPHPRSAATPKRGKKPLSVPSTPNTAIPATSLPPIPSSSSASVNNQATNSNFPQILLDSEEKLPPCRNCGKVDGLVHGAHDFTQLIIQRQQDKINKIELERISAEKIVQCYRNYLLRQYGRSIIQTKRTIKYLQYLAAIKINALGRGRLARRRFITEKALKVIKTSHPLLIKHSLRSKPGEKKVFWYKREVERRMLFHNYLNLIDKTGNHPPRIIVERNIIEIAKRILIRKNELITLIQKRWRGFLSRRIVKYFRTEISRMFSINVAKVIRIQSVYRGHTVRLYMARYLYEKTAEKVMTDYRNERLKKRLMKEKQESKELSIYSYQKDFAIEKSARFMGKLPYALDYNQEYNELHHLQPKFKLQIYESSYHSDHKTMHLLENNLQNNQSFVDYENSFIYNDIFRKQFILNRIDEKGPLGYGKRSGEDDFRFTAYNSSIFMNTKEQIEAILKTSLMKKKEKEKEKEKKKDHNKTTGGKIDLLKPPETSRQKSMRIYFQQDLTEIANRVIERVNKGLPPLGAVDMNYVEKMLQKMKKRHEKMMEVDQQQQLVRVNNDENHSVSTGTATIADGDRRYNKHSLKLLKDFKQYNRERLQPLSATENDNINELALIMVDRNSPQSSPLRTSRSRKSSRVGSSSSSSRRTSMQSTSEKTSAGNGNAVALIGTIPEQAVEKKKVRKGFQYPKEVAFNAMSWLYSNEDF